MKKLIICDDDKDILEMMSLVLRNQPFEVIKIDHCNHLQETIDIHNPFLVLIDLSFDNSNIKNLILSLKKQEKYASIPFVIFSGHEDITTITPLIGADDFISKPFKVKEIKDKIQTYLN